MTLDRLGAALSDRYRIERELGAGGMATVYLAEDLRHSRKVAIKVMHAEVSAELASDRFLREIRTTAGLQHPHIVPLLDSGEADGLLYYVMPLIEGESLRDRLARERSLGVDEALRLTRELADALQYAHDSGILHRDLKPENVLVSRGHAMLVDFGIARLRTQPGDERLTRTGTAVGTPAYMSPEQATGDHDLSPASDVYGLASILYEMLTGEPPFTGPTFEAILVKRFTRPAPRPRTLRADTPTATDLAVTRALARDPADRFTSARDFASALRVEPAQAAPSAPAERVLVVLPFVNQSPDPDNDYFSDGLTEEIITDLSHVRGVRVLSRTSSMQLKGTTKSVRTLGEELGIRYALAGSVRKAGSSLRITAELIDAANETTAWSERFSGTLDDIFDVQERVAREIVKALGLTLTASEDSRLAERPIKDAGAYEIYLRAQALVRRYGSSMEQVEALIAKAMEIEGATPPLRALRAYLWVSQMRSGMQTGHESLARAEAEAHALIEVAPRAPYGYALLGFISYETGDQSATVRHLRQALERDPSDADALFFLGIALGGAGQIEAAIEAGRRFLAMDPLSPMAGVLVNSSNWFAGRPTEGLDAHERGLVLDPENPIIHWSLGYTYALLGRRAEAWARAEWMRTRVPAMPYTAQLLSLLHGIDGDAEAARAVLQSIEGLAFDGHITFHLAESWAAIGDEECALTFLRDAIERGFYPHDYIATHCPFFSSLRRRPEFAAIAARAAERVAAFSP